MASMLTCYAEKRACYSLISYKTKKHNPAPTGAERRPRTFESGGVLSLRETGCWKSIGLPLAPTGCRTDFADIQNKKECGGNRQWQNHYLRNWAAKYERQGDYLIPCLTVPAEEEQAIGIWGQRHLDYLKQYRKVTYTNLLTSGRLNAYLADINRQAQERFERLIEGMKQAQGITEQLKAENALEWTGCLNNIRACAREIVEKEIIFA